MTVKTAPGADEVNLENVTLTWVGPEGATQLTHIYDSESSSASDNFTVTTFKDSDDSNPVLNGPDDRFTMNFDAAAIENLENNDRLAGETRVEIQLTTMPGGETSVVINVPGSLQG